LYREADPLTGDLFLLAEQARLKGEDVVEHPLDPPAFQPMVRYEATGAEHVAKAIGKRPINACSPLGQRVLQYLQALVECSHA